MRISDWSSDVCSSDLCDRRRCLQDALQLLDEIVRVQEAHAAKEHVDAAAPCLHLGQAQRHEIVVVHVDASRHPAGGQIAPGLILEASRAGIGDIRSEEHTSELQSLIRISYAVFCLQQKYRD